MKPFSKLITGLTAVVLMLFAAPAVAQQSPTETLKDFFSERQCTGTATDNSLSYNPTVVLKPDTLIVKITHPADSIKFKYVVTYTDDGRPDHTKEYEEGRLLSSYDVSTDIVRARWTYLLYDPRYVIARFGTLKKLSENSFGTKVRLPQLRGVVLEDKVVFTINSDTELNFHRKTWRDGKPSSDLSLQLQCD